MDIHSTSTIYLLILCLIILPLSSSHAQAHTFKYCDEENAAYDIKVSRVEISPNPVVRGDPFIIKTTAYNAEPIPGGIALYTITYDGGVGHITYTSVLDLCKERHCPIPAGNLVLTQDDMLPAVAPTGTYYMNMTVLDLKAKQLTCIISPFKIEADDDDDEEESAVSAN